MVALNGETTNVQTSGDGGVLILIIFGTGFSGDETVIIFSAARKRVAAARSTRSAGPALEVAATILANITNGQVVPIETRNLHLDTFVVGVSRASVRAGTKETLEGVVKANSTKLIKKRFPSVSRNQLK